MKNNLAGLLSTMRQYASLNKVPIIGERGAVLLGGLVTKHRPLRILEIGTAIGYSALLMHSCQPPAAKITTIEKDAVRLTAARQFFQAAGVTDEITLLAGDAKDILPFLEGYFDFVFLDAAKGQYLVSLRQILDKLAPKALIVADNVLFRGYVEAAQDTVPRRFRTIANRLKEYLNFVQTDSRFQTEIFPEGDGLAVSYYTQSIKPLG
ncbi:MAG: O-methyltransferase [Sporomusaceae bacterium]|jgi:predicted O-methyltransferase YrrM|nr:O-methyltransferase [Sporomusaceae bacterium]